MNKRYTLKELILESPDSIILSDDKKLTYRDDDAYAFGYYKDKMYVGKPGAHHGYLYVPNIRKDNPSIYYNGQTRDVFDMPGRVWMDEKIISFWYHPSVQELNKVLKDLTIAFKETNGIDYDFINNKSKFGIEVINTDGLDIPDDDPDFGVYYGKSKIIPINDYTGSGRWSDDELKRSHTDVGSGGKEVKPGWGSLKRPDNPDSTEAERRFSMGEALDNILNKEL